MKENMKEVNNFEMNEKEERNHHYSLSFQCAWAVSQRLKIFNGIYEKAE